MISLQYTHVAYILPAVDVDNSVNQLLMRLDNDSSMIMQNIKRLSNSRN